MKRQEIIQRCEELYQDLSFTAVKEWKEANNAKAIGFLPTYVPRELIHAAGMLPVGLMGGGDSIEIIRGDAYFQSYICHMPRSMVELMLNKKLDHIDGFLFPAICDVVRNLSGIWQLLSKDKFIHYLDVPQNFDEEIGGTFYMQELQLLKHAFEKMMNTTITPEALTRSIELYNENRAVIEQLYQLRAEKPHILPTYELYLLMRASNVLDVEDHTAMLKQYLEIVSQEEGHALDNIKVVLTGAFCEQPPLNLIRVLERSGCYIVEDDWVICPRFIQGPIQVNGDPLAALAHAYLHQGISTASRYEEDRTKGQFLVEQVKRTQAEGVIFCAPSFCDPALLERPMLQAALNKQNIPYTSFKYSENSGQFQVIKEQAGTFADSIKLWGA